MVKDGISPNGSQKWTCSKVKRLRNKRDKDNRIQLSIAGIYCNYRVDPDKKEELWALISEFRAQQKRDYSEVNKVWLDQLDNPGK